MLRQTREYWTQFRQLDSDLASEDPYGYAEPMQRASLSGSTE